ncbi:MAG: transglutaminase domain-containing protein [Candidatus Omnitrophica bacterium]|nr:transglutaminase domain-containing protein [Candidatus Omnitrophota bacterium]
MIKIIKRIVTGLLICALIIVIINIPVSTKQGVNGSLFIKTIPLYVKICGFFYRDYEYYALAKRLTTGRKTDLEKINAIYGWTIHNIKKQPQGFPVTDDHIWNIIIKGYGTTGQMADVFTTLASYSGFESFFYKVKTEDNTKYLILAFVKVQNKWHAFDVYNNISFIDENKYSVETPLGINYGECIKRINKRWFDYHPRRPDKQKFFPRIFYETTKVFFGEYD